MRLSVVVPCYNEEIRGRAFLNELVSFCKKNLADYELLLIDDGSKDETYRVLVDVAQADTNVRVLRHETNLGKGATVRKGIVESKGDFVMFIDADGSTAPDQIPRLVEELEQHDIVIGNRYTREAAVVQPFSRYVLGTIFNFYTNMIFELEIHDCLCGFKGFKRNIAVDLFENLIDTRWLFDVEILYKAKMRGYTIKKIATNWVYKTGTKIKLCDPILFLFQLLALKKKLRELYGF